MITHNKNLWVNVLNKEQHDRTCNYWYVVTAGATSHTAFNTEHGFLQYLAERGLKILEPLTTPGDWSGQAIIGEYCEESHMNPAEFYALDFVAMTRVMDNADYTLGLITEDVNKVRKVHHLNPNVHDRPVFEYFTSNRAMN